MAEPPLRILFAVPAYWPATQFGGPTAMAKALTEGLVRAGHSVEVLTTSLRTVAAPPGSRFRTRRAEVGGVSVRYLATPLRYRWMGITPTLPLAWRRLATADVVHIFGYRDFVTTLTAQWARRRGIPYVFEPLDMFLPRFRKVRLKRVFDRVLGGPVARRAALVVANSAHERAQLVAAGLAAERIETRPNGFPPPYDGGATGALRARLGLADDVPLVLNVGRVSFKKGLDLLLEAVAALPQAHLAVVGPDDGDGTMQRLERLRRELGVQKRVHLVGPLDTSRPGDVYADADVFVLPSRNESFGMVAAEAASAGVPVVVTDRCGVAELLTGAALVVPCEAQAMRTALAQLLDDAPLRSQLVDAARRVARATSWQTVVERQVELYRLALARG